jgi:hypothetical protein
MHLISTIHISHHYAALCKLQLIPAYYPGTKSCCLISGHLAAAEEQPCPSVETHLTHNPCCFEDLIIEGQSISFKQALLDRRTTVTFFLIS